MNVRPYWNLLNVRLISVHYKPMPENIPSLSSTSCSLQMPFPNSMVSSWIWVWKMLWIINFVPQKMPTTTFRLFSRRFQFISGAHIIYIHCCLNYWNHPILYGIALWACVGPSCKIVMLIRILIIVGIS